MTTCERYAELESAERYVAGRMAADEAADFEQHFLACDACLATVRGIEDVRDVLAERRAAIGRGEAEPFGAAEERSRPLWTWAAAAGLAAAVLAAGVLWMRGGVPSPSGLPGSEAGAPSAVARDAAPSRSGTSPVDASGAAATPSGTSQPSSPAIASSQPQGTPPSAGAPGAAPAPTGPAPSGPIALIARLAIVIPPPYVAVPVRGEVDDAQQAFAAAMARYRASDHAGAAEGLRKLVEKSPDLASAQFYLGVSELMVRQPRRAETALRAAADSDVTPYADEAWFYLGKAALQRGDLSAAERALTEAVARDAGPGNEARTLLDEVRALGRS